MKVAAKHLVVKKSTIPESGKGLFTKIFLPKGTRITEYKGKITTWKEVDHLNGDNGYIYYVKRNHVIDAGPNKKILARYANDAKGLKRIAGLTNNAEYLEDGNRVFITSKKDILPGQEIFVSYGKEYWEVIRYNQKLEAKRKAKKG